MLRDYEVARRAHTRVTSAAGRLVFGLKVRVGRVVGRSELQPLIAATGLCILNRWIQADNAAFRRHVMNRTLIKWWASVVLGALLAVRNLAAAQELLASVPPEWSSQDDPMWQLRELQVWCLSGKLDRAQELVAGWGGLEKVPQPASATTAGLLAALGRWDDIVEFLANRVDQGLAVQGYLFLEAVAGAARHTGRYDEVIDLLSRPPRRHEVEQTRNGLVAEAELLDVIGLRPNKPTREVQDRLLADRLRVFKEVVSGRCPRALRVPPPDESTVTLDGVVVWCTDRQYLLGTCVSVWSLLRHNPGFSPSSGLRVVVAPDVLDLARQVMGQLATAGGIDIAVTDADAMVPTEHDLRTAYGLFTPGHVLAAAAYYRLFAVRDLMAEVPEGRIVYLDSDTCVGPGAAGLFSLDLGPHPLAARSERPMGLRFESRRVLTDQAARNMGLDPGSYFNSGVLVFDGSHGALSTGLDRAIHLALEEPERLMFHDQCALNLAFAGKVAPLDETFNRFVRPQNAATGDSPVVLHYLERPKPWDPLYPTINCQRWMDELVGLSTVLDPRHISAMLGLQFPRNEHNPKSSVAQP
jgi:lipopolysaccharide biosynthesis glycosyltransferase